MRNKKKIIIFLLLFFIFTFCSNVCFSQNIYCSMCGSLINGKYYQCGNLIICENCFNNLPKCSTCGLPVKEYKIVNEKIYCLNCLKQLYFCFYCNNPITGQACCVKSKINDKTYYFCKNCYYNNKGHACFACGIIFRTSTMLKDGRYICNECLKQSVTNTAQIQNIYSQVINLVYNKIAIKPNKIPVLNIVSKQKLDLLNKNSDDKLGTYYSQKKFLEMGNYKKELSSDSEIYILSHIPLCILKWVIAHEYAHSWFFDNTKREFTKEQTEGFAEWVAYKIMDSEKDKIIINTMLKRNDIYGKGLKKMIELEKKIGINGIINYFKNN